MNRVITALAFFCLLASCSPDKIYFEKRPMLGTVVQITVIAANQNQANRALNAAFAEIKRIENMISYYDPGSDISKINSSEQAVFVSAETFALIKKCNELSVLSEGSFDISFAGVGRLWKFGDGFKAPPEKEIKSRLKLVNYRNIILDEKNKTVRLAVRGMKIGLGSIGKRYAIGRAVEKLRKNGIQNGIVQTGGDLQAIGTKFGKFWTVGVKNPRGEGLFYTFPVRPGETVSTSGDYERGIVTNGKRYHHIFDPRTGYPTETFSSVTVITGIPENADGLSTAVFVMGKGDFKKLLTHFEKTCVILIDLDLNVYASKELKDRLTPVDEKSPGIQWF